jgi:tRNA modification GTPase
MEKTAFPGALARGEKPAYGDEGPITAFATPLGDSALTLIRCSGKNALALAASVFSPAERLREAPANSIVRGWIVERGGRDGDKGGEKIDEVLVSVYRAPKSYTGEEGLDISCHGGLAAGQGVMRQLRAAGFRDALPGEFTLRAFMNGKLDLTRCESVMELVAAKPDPARRRAISRLSGVLEGEIRGVKNLLVEVLAGTELFLDYSEDELEPGDAGAAGNMPGRLLAEEALARLKKLSASWAMEKLCREGVLTVIAGRPNAGKSSLFNLLLKEERSIVTEIPGTTRDWIEGWVSLGGIPLRLMDTAGLRETGDGQRTDMVEQIGMERSRELISRADLILYVIDGAGGITEADRLFLGEYGPGGKGRAPLILIWNKTDIRPPAVPAELFPGNRVLGLCAKTGGGLAELISTVPEALSLAGGGWDAGSSPEGPGIGTARQKELIDRAGAAVEEALSLAARGEALDLIAPLLREGVNALGEITGEVSTAEILETMFSRFCLGK